MSQPSSARATNDGAAPLVHTEAHSAFASLGLSGALQRGVAAAGYTTPTPIQRESIPHVLEGRDLLGSAQTGTGKTAAFALPILQRLAATHDRGFIRALILAPTRELAAQIGASFERYAGTTGLRTLVIFGGVSKQGQIRSLKQGIEILVATPGRLLDLHQEGYVALGRTEAFVLDEADRMLDMGFIHDVKRVVRALPKVRQNLLFSATMPKEIDKLASNLLHDPVRVAVDPISSTREPIEQSVYHVDKSNKTQLLVRLLKGEGMDRVLVFSRTKHGANRLVKNLEASGFGAAAIHGNKSQSARVRALEDFKAGRIAVVVATDIAARGIDIKELSHVINYELPNEPESYVHRVGRTGRAGRSGIAISLCAPEERPYLRSIERLTQRALVVCPVPEGLARDPQPRAPRGTETPSRTPGRGGGGRSGPRRTGGGGGGGGGGGRGRSGGGGGRGGQGRR